MGKKDILGAVHVTLDNGIQVKFLFIRNRNKRSEWLAILRTDRTLDNEEIVRIYGMRWDIEVFFKCSKSLLNLEKEFQGRSCDLLIIIQPLFLHAIFSSHGKAKRSRSQNVL